MRNKRQMIVLLLLAITVAGCSSRGVSMPRHRKKKNCDCPTFSDRRDLRQDERQAVWV